MENNRQLDFRKSAFADSEMLFVLGSSFSRALKSLGFFDVIDKSKSKLVLTIIAIIARFIYCTFADSDMQFVTGFVVFTIRNLLHLCQKQLKFRYFMNGKRP